MRVEPSGVQPQPTRPANSSPVRSADKAGDGGPAAAAAGFEPTSELARLIAIANNAPEVRTELVTNIAEREAAAATARAMLDPTR